MHRRFCGLSDLPRVAGQHGVRARVGRHAPRPAGVPAPRPPARTAAATPRAPAGPAPRTPPAGVGGVPASNAAGSRRAACDPRRTSVARVTVGGPATRWPGSTVRSAAPASFTPSLPALSANLRRRTSAATSATRVPTVTIARPAAPASLAGVTSLSAKRCRRASGAAASATRLSGPNARPAASATYTVHGNCVLQSPPAPCGAACGIGDFVVWCASPCACDRATMPAPVLPLSRANATVSVQRLTVSAALPAASAAAAIRANA
jgi:hypothetical protein